MPDGIFNYLFNPSGGSPAVLLERLATRLGPLLLADPGLLLPAPAADASTGAPVEVGGLVADPALATAWPAWAEEPVEAVVAVMSLLGDGALGPAGKPDAGFAPGLGLCASTSGHGDGPAHTIYISEQLCAIAQ